MSRTKHPPASRAALRRKILSWYAKSGRSLPWRDTRNPYRILISEVMLQQTQVSRVLVHYPRFLRRFPDFRKLARARLKTVLTAWRGMGYNNRAVRLRTLARLVMSRHGGSLPRSPEELHALPGIGRYSAHAIACFAFGHQVPVVETNVKRVLSRLVPRSSDPWTVAWDLLPRNRAYEWNQALMDLGALICTPSRPDCPACPVRRLCPSAHRPVQQQPSRHIRERGRAGIPNRIYRGRIVEVLRGRHRNAPISARELGPLIKTRFSRSDERWLENLVKSLEKDGILRVEGRSRQPRIFFAE